MRRIKYKTLHEREKDAHRETETQLRAAEEIIIENQDAAEAKISGLEAESKKHQQAMWQAQRVAQVERQRYEEAERERAAVAMQVDGLKQSNARLQAERDLLLLLIRDGSLRAHAGWRASE